MCQGGSECLQSHVHLLEIVVHMWCGIDLLELCLEQKTFLKGV